MGLVVSVFRVRDIVARTDSEPARSSRLPVVFFDLDARPGERLLYPRNAHFDRLDDLPEGLTAVRTISVGGRAWQIAAFPPPGTFQPARHGSWLTLVGGLLLAMSGLLVTLRGRRWAALSSTYEAPAARAEAPPATDKGAWDALDRGEDPTD